ncbi:MAG: hypothetical protein M1827_004902 [Pycnora praestabilis]|nr:MAG: hypothetical protein M1827_004902 [Pycnora praestabilis]
MPTSSNDMSSSLFNPLTLSSGLKTTTKCVIPPFLYGTAWKKERTTGLVVQALHSGFKGIDTAAQPRHYREDLVGDGLRQALGKGAIGREDLYIQSKFTSINGQDPDNLPYDPASSIPEQIRTSITSSLKNLRWQDNEKGIEQNSYLDCLVLHSPLPTIAQTLEAWTTLESYVPHQIHNLGISNVQLPLLIALYDAVKIKPAVVQNRFYAATHFDVPLRKFCREKGIVYQSFWTLTGNPGLLKSEPVNILAREAAVEKQVALYCLVLGLENVVVLNGTTNEERMKGDIQGLEKVRSWIESDGKEWDLLLSEFKALIGERS